MFTSLGFWIFALAVLLLHNTTRGRLQNAILLAASYLLYVYFDWQFLLLLIAATTLTFVAGRNLAPTMRYRRLFFYAGILFDLGVLVFFKYAGFFTASISAALNGAGTTAQPYALNILLPLGLSFYIFRLLSYLFDVYSGRLAPTASWIDVALYVAFFPQIAAGPIERATHFLPRLQVTRRLDQAQFVTGLTYIFVGLFYKIAIADPLAPMTERTFSNISQLMPLDALAAIIWFSIRLYADFAGYSALAIGFSTWFGLPAMENFRQPYFSQSITEFWTRWHISLSTWFRDYLFYPLTRFLLKRLGRRFALAINAAGLLITMLVTGLWHGSSLTFSVWGLLHGVYLIWERLLARPPTASPGRWQHRITVVFNILVTQCLVAIAWVFFRAPTVQDALLFFQKLLAPNYALDSLWLRSVATPLIVLILFDVLLARAVRVTAFWDLHLIWRVALLAVLVVALFILGSSSSEAFVYVRF
ncbi:MAG: MBOAT family O-acyltransferase [Chloroflexota bacterium]